MSSFFSRNCRPEEVAWYIQSAERKSCQPRIHWPAKLFRFFFKKKIKNFPDMQSWKSKAHYVRLTGNVKETSLSWKEGEVLRNKKHDRICLIDKGKYIVKVVD